MKRQEVISIIQQLPESVTNHQDLVVKTYPVIDEALEKGMYIESMVQTAGPNNSYIITFVIRHYNDLQASI